jgi:hypothetical protein
LEAFFLNLGFLFVFHDDVLTICFFSLTFADDGTLEESTTVVAHACFLQEFVVHLEIHVEWVDSNHQREEPADMQLADFRIRNDIEEFEVMVHAHDNISRLKLFQTVEPALWTKFQVCRLVLWIVIAIPSSQA